MRGLTFVAMGCTLLLGACSAITDFDRFHAADGTDGGGADGSIDGGADAGPCTAPRPEECNGRDDDCDGAADETFDLDADPNHCGSCDNACGAVANGAPDCGGGECVPTCDLGFRDCDGDYDTGCEADLDAPETCGACDVACDTAMFCAATGCVDACPDGTEECGTSCVDVTSDPSHCGACDAACADPPGGRPTCVDSTCGIECDSGLGNCDGMADNGCETAFTSVMHCGACGNACPSRANASPTCDGTTCGFVCTMGFADCDGNPANGCEASLGSMTSCRACGVMCSGGTPVCDVAMGCVSGCTPPADTLCGTSCVDTDTNASHCGMCGMVCSAPNATGTCSAGACVYACNPDFGNCDGMPVNGCEQSLTTLTHCGMCARECTRANATATCATGMCRIGVCDTGFASCDGVDLNGCEVNLVDNTLNCGTCGAACFLDCLGGFCDEAIGVSAGGDHSCAEQASGGMVCWGADDAGQLGDGPPLTGRPRPGPIAITNVIQQDAGNSHTCAVLRGGGVRCWGANASGQLGNGTTTGSAMPVVVTGLPAGSNAAEVGAGLGFSCARLNGGAVFCWGVNDLGQLGNNTTTSSTTPVQAVGITDAVDLSVGWQHACVVRSGGAVLCWGRNSNGQIGNGNTMNQLRPVPVSGLSGATAVAAGTSHTCAVATAVVCWGDNSAGQLGNGTTANSLIPVAVVSIPRAALVTAGDRHSCATNTDNEAFCWGLNDNGQVGDGTTSSQVAPASVTRSVTAIDAGQFHTCAIASGRLQCWGAGGGGRLGDGGFVDRLLPSNVLHLPPPP